MNPRRLLALLLPFLTLTASAVAQPAGSSTQNSGLRITPYGMIWTNAAWESARTNSGDFVFFVFSPETEGEPTFHLDIKSTRIGFDLAGPSVGRSGALQSTGKVEVDFQGAFTTENKASVLLRHAYWELRNQKVRILAGQTWDVISPLNPGMLMYSVGWGGGNIGYRRAQIRGEVQSTTPTTRVGIQASANTNIVTDFVGSPTITGDHSDLPVFQGRVWAGIGKNAGPNLTVGLSGHYGEQVFDFPPQQRGYDARLETSSLNVDARLRLTPALAIQGEAFRGKNLGTFLGGVLQGVCSCLEQSVRSQGGWFELAYDANPIHLHAGAGVDDPKDEDFADPGKRTYNRMLFANASFNATKELLLGVEVSHWRTEYNTLETGESLNINLMGRYSF